MYRATYTKSRRRLLICIIFYAIKICFFFNAFAASIWLLCGVGNVRWWHRWRWRRRYTARLTNFLYTTNICAAAYYLLCVIVKLNNAILSASIYIRYVRFFRRRCFLSTRVWRVRIFFKSVRIFKSMP